jgi:protein involved in ribonucleotide reduction
VYYYSKADNEFLEVLNEDEARINLTTKQWETEQDSRYIILYHPILKEEIRINESEWLRDKERVIKENIKLEIHNFHQLSKLN